MTMLELEVLTVRTGMKSRGAAEASDNQTSFALKWQTARKHGAQS